MTDVKALIELSCLYWAGMALNDHTDRFVDIIERPDRPLPSGRIRPKTALAAAGGLTAAGLGLAAVTTATAAAANYAWRFGRAQAAVVRDGRADIVRKAVGAGIMSLMSLQASPIAGRGRPGAALPIAAAGPVARRLARKISPT